MPTTKEFDDLVSKCDWTWTTQNGVDGYIVRGRGTYSSNSIFLPCAGNGYGTSLNFSGSNGYYWSSVPYSDSYYAYGLYFFSSDHYTRNYHRYYGRSVRPVQDPPREKVQLWAGGPYWATTNIGAEKPQNPGYYFWWGDTVGYRREGDKWVATDGSSSDFTSRSRPRTRRPAA